ncbi:hypothetical protein [Facklamia sp. P13055]|uniref:hypothetical protein n=1 Tax=Facklamia sp. P13055 TaxID=3421952 RepID=UPI003D1700B8
MHSINFETFKRFAFPVHLGIIMPLIMTAMQGQVVFPEMLVKLSVLLPVSVILGAYLLDIPKMSEQFNELLGIQHPEWLKFVVGQFPPALIFSFVMGFLGVWMEVGINGQAFLDVLKGLPLTVFISMIIQMLVSLLIDKGYQKWFFSN